MKRVLKKVFNMDKRERLLRLCQLGAKEQMSVLSFEEQIEMDAIQAIRMENGEIAKVLEQRMKDHPETRTPEQGVSA